MKYSVASVLALVLASGIAHAQEGAPQPAEKPVEATEAPENRATDPDAEVGELPAPGSGQPAAVVPTSAVPPAATPAKWDVSAPRGATLRQVPIRTDEGTWMDVDVSPDGRTVAFSLLGDIYTMPITGGVPTRISEGLAWDVQPRFSPDGRRIAYVSDRGGGDNIWLMNSDGTGSVALTKEDFRLLNQPSWSPDGQYIVAKKHFTTGRSLGTGEVWLYHVGGGGGVKLVARPNEQHQKELGEPTFAPDGKSVYFTRNNTPGPIFEYAQDSTQGIFEIERYEIATGQTTTAVSGFGGAVRPAPSPDGKSIAFVRRDAGKTGLWVKDLASGIERKIYDDLDRDVQETWAVTGVYPNMDWTPNSRSIVFWSGGKLRRIGADGGAAAEIPFRIDDSRAVANAPHPRIPVGEDTVTNRMVRFAAVSPDGRQVVYESLGQLYVKPMAGGTARRLVSGGGDALEMYPAWSRDGRQIAFVSWTDAGLGKLMTVSAGGGSARTLTSQPGHYANPAFSPDGRTIVFEKRGGGSLTSPDWSENPGVYRVAASGGTPELIGRGNGAPHFGAEADRVFMVGSSGGKYQLVSTDLNGEAKRVHAEGELANDFRVSPDGRTIAFRQNYEIFAMPLMPGGLAVAVDEKGGALPITRVSSGGAEWMHWSGGGSQLHWSMGPTVFSAPRNAFFANAPQGADAPKFVPPANGVSLARTVPADKHRGTVALVGARVLTMAGEGAGAIEDGVIVINDDRITAIGPRASTPVPAGARVVDVTGKTVMPGLIDAHAHGPEGEGDLIPQQNWAHLQTLALGTTTVHNPSAQASQIFAASERQRAGLMLAPRIFSTGEIVYGAKAADVYARIDNYEDALAHVRRIKAQGGVSIKNYNQPRREQRQQVVAAARAENMLVVAEGGSLYGMDMNLAVDGNSTVEHNVPVEHFYEDMLQLWAGTQANYTPTLVVTYGGLAGDPYWRQATNVWENPLMIHTPPKQLLAATARRTTAPEWAFVDDENAREAKKLADRGVKVSIGAHGQQPGIAAHWELWSFVRGGMTPVEALRAGTIVSAQSLGMDRDIGSLEPGKLADLLVLDADPSVDIRNSDKITRVMLGGRMYDARTMNEVETGSARRAPYWWENAAGTGSATPGRATAESHGDGD
ncbi:amidohydrolase family protein [Altererythrobacter aerius]|uniref:Amidohydrolase family protein n=1 Tax=Tsuneonella aeria TaxID=1837929 RepID=A0A6I4TGQ3_9SPHN|nr:amidohydrolase family protein [Tsuneonella aeria]MXO75804.1 amidohydrolase family protein [Tsuneonella aeria]